MTKPHTGSVGPLPEAPDGRQSAPSAVRNLGPILAVLRRHLPTTGAAIELASGTGQQIAAFAAAFPGIHWTPTEADPERLASIEAWRIASGQSNLDAPVPLTIGAGDWPFPAGSADAALTVNLLHLVGAAVAEALFAGMARVLTPGGMAFIYGPFSRQGRFVSAGDRAFHASLTAMDPAIGYKDRDWVAARALAAGLRPLEWVDMPANNLMLVAVRAHAAG
jgi:SAM-dependent methyltransferase